MPARQDASAHGAGVVVELHLHKRRAHPRGLAGALLRALKKPRWTERQPAEQAKPGQAERDREPELPARVAAAPVAETAPAAVPIPSPKPQVRTGWIIQVGAYPAEDEAKQQLSTVKSKASRLLAAADPFTESVHKGGTTLYRARFAGLDKDRAEAACKYLKRNDVDCVTLKN